MDITIEDREDLQFLMNQAGIYHMGAAWGVSEFAFIIEEIVTRYMRQQGLIANDSIYSKIDLEKLKTMYNDQIVHYIGYPHLCKISKKYLEKLTDE